MGVVEGFAGNVRQAVATVVVVIASMQSSAACGSGYSVLVSLFSPRETTP